MIRSFTAHRISTTALLFTAWFLLVPGAVFCQTQVDQPTSQAAEEDDQLNVDEAFARARALAFDGKRQRAKRILRNLSKQKPNYTDIRVFLARVMAWDEEFDDARTEIEAVLAGEPFHRQTLRLYFDVEMWDDNFQHALELADRYLRDNPDDIDFLYRKARALYALDKKLESHLLLNHILQIDPTYGQAHKLLTRVEDDFEEAAKKDRQARKIPARQQETGQDETEREKPVRSRDRNEPPSVNEMFKQARTYAFNGERQKAMELLREILKPRPDSHEVRMFLARVMSWEDEYAAARDELNYILKKDPFNRQTFQVYFDLEMWDDKPGKALDIAQRYLDQFPGDQDFIYRKARALYYLDREQEARDVLRIVLKEDPEHERALELSERIEKALRPEPEEPPEEEETGTAPADSREDDTSGRGKPPKLREVYNQARAYAFNKERDKAKILMKEILKAKPGTNYVRVFLARVMAWDDEYDSARKQLKYILRRNPFHKEALQVLFDIEWWDDRPHKALGIAEGYLLMNPEDEDFRYRRARILNSMDCEQEAVWVLEDLLADSPEHEEAVKLYNRLTDKEEKEETKPRGRLDITREPDKVSVSYKRDSFSETFADWETLAYSYSQKVGPAHKPWTMILRLTTATRFGKDGEQYEIDMYPKIRDGTYAYLSFGMSSDSIFSRQRYGLEFYQSLPHSFECSLGLRHLIFSASTVTIYTGTLGHYFGSYWVSLRTYHTPKDVSSSNSWTLTLRQYLWGGESYLEFSGGFGSSPDDNTHSDLITELKSEKWGIGLNRRLRRDRYFSLGYSQNREEVRENVYRTRETYSMGLEQRL